MATITINDINALNGVQRVAIVLLAVDDFNASKIFSLMDEEEIREVSYAMSNLGSISIEVVDHLLNKLNNELAGSASFLGNLNTVEKILGKFLDGDKLQNLLEDIRGPQGKNTWEKLTNVGEDVLAMYLHNEHPQVAALILSKLPPMYSAKVLNNLPDNYSFDIILRMLNLGSVKKEVLDRMEKVLRFEFISNVSKTLKQDSCGLLAEIFNNLDASNESKYMGMLEKQVPELAEKIKELMFTFDDLIRLDRRSVQLLLRAVDKTKLIIALKGASSEVKKFFFESMPQRAARIIAEELESMGPIKIRDANQAHTLILNTAKELMAKGEIEFIAGKDEYIL